MNKYQKLVAKSKVEGIKNAYILASAYKKDRDDDYLILEYNLSFLYDAGEIAAEWEPRYGPIRVWEKASENDENAKEHYYYDYVVDNPLSWSQLAVERNGLQEAFLRGDFEHIFSVLKRWASRSVL